MKDENPEWDLKKRTRGFALRILQLYSILPKTVEAQVLGKQMLRSGTSVGAHYREGMRSRSRNEFIAQAELSFASL
jgi:four helix bundle protein